MPKFIIIEGIDGSGKTTQCERLSHYFGIAKQEMVAVVSEGRSTALGERLFEMIKWPDFRINKAAVAYMIAAARHQLVESQIIPHLENNTNVICDRFTPSGLVYGNIDCGLSLKTIEKVFPSIVPDAIFILDIQPHVAIQRMKDKTKDSFEDVDWRVIVHRRELYLKIAQSEAYLPKWTIINAELSEDKVHNQIVSYIEQLK